MAGIVASTRSLVLALGAPFAMFAAAIQDPFRWLVQAGFMTAEPYWLVSAQWRQFGLLVFAFVWLGVWYHRQRMKFEDSQPPEPNMPLHQACRWIARDSVWASKFDPALDNHWPSEVDDEIMSKLMTGKIEMFGRRREPHLSKGPMQLVTPNDKDKVQWESGKLAMSEPPTHMWITGGTTYYTVMLDERQVHRVWPRRSLWHRLTRRSPVERIGDYSKIFDEQDKYYRERLGFSSTPLAAILEAE